MGSRSSLLAVILLLFGSVVCHAQTITCTNWKFFKAPSPWTNFGAGGINRWGTVVGGVSQDPSTITHGFVRYSNGGFNFYRVPNSIGTSFLHRNALGVSVGYYTDSSYITHGLVVSGSSRATVDYPGATITELTSINYW